MMKFSSCVFYCVEILFQAVLSCLNLFLAVLLRRNFLARCFVTLEFCCREFCHV